MAEAYDDATEAAKRAIGRLSCGRQYHRTAGEYTYRWEDVAAAVARIRRPVRGSKDTIPDILTQSLLLWLWAGDSGQYAHLVPYMIAEVSSPAVRWKKAAPLEPGQLRALVETALCEEISRRPCRTCRAGGWVIDPRNPRRDVVCSVCQGQGSFDWSVRQRAAAMGVSAFKWRKVWAPRYAWVQRLIARLEARGVRKVGWALGIRGS